MKIYCTSHVNCGNVRTVADDLILTEEDFICDLCYSLSLPYEDNDIPSWLDLSEIRGLTPSYSLDESEYANTNKERE